MFDKFSQFWIFKNLLMMSPSGYYYLSKGETECNFSPRDGRMLEVNDCYVIADTLRFFSENYGAFCPSLKYTEAFLQPETH